jgi:GT2 family glycosyltransferase
MLDTQRPVVSICIANYQGERILGDCLDSVLKQKSAPDYEILVHDDASKDKSLEVIERYAGVRLIRSSENVGFCISNNRMAAEARGEFLLLLNNDARLFEDALATLHSESTRHEHQAVLGLPQYDATTGKLIDRGEYLDFFASPIAARRAQQRELAMVMGACLWIPTQAWRQIGGFPEWFVTNAEDVYLCCYARALGYKVFVPDRSGFYHIVGHSLGGGKAADNRLRISPRRRHFSERNRLLVQWVFYPAWMIPVTFAANLLALLVEAALLILVNRRTDFAKHIYVESVVSAWRARHRAIASRRVLAKARRTSAWAFFAPFRLIPQKLRLLAQVGFPRAMP